MDKRLYFSGRSGEQKYVQMVAYLFELGYDLAIGRFTIYPTAQASKESMWVNV